ncbi:MAG: hypothetical protein HC905_18055 [Bacteroidales bacterium]|nr:hypothetical protein [Bacteroidales bacterium]
MLSLHLLYPAKEEKRKKELGTIVSTVSEKGKEGKQKYGIKSGIVEYKTQTMGTDVAQTLYFDDYGAKEATEMQMEIAGMKSNTRSIIKGEIAYSLDLNSKSGTKSRITSNLGAEIDFQNLSEEVLKK